MAQAKKAAKKAATKADPRAAVLKVLKGERTRLQGLVEARITQANEQTAQAEAECENAKENADLDFQDTESEIATWLEDETDTLEAQIQAIEDLIESY